MSSVTGVQTCALPISIKQRQEEGKERKAIDTEAKQTARKKYMDLYRTEKTKVETERMKQKAREDAGAKSPITRKLQPVGKVLKTTGKALKPVAKGTFDFLGKAGKNFLESDQLNFGNPNIDFGFGPKPKPTSKATTRKKGKKQAKPKPNPFAFY